MHWRPCMCARTHARTRGAVFASGTEAQALCTDQCAWLGAVLGPSEGELLAGSAIAQADIRTVGRRRHAACVRVCGYVGVWVCVCAHGVIATASRPYHDVSRQTHALHTAVQPRTHTHTHTHAHGPAGPVMCLWTQEEDKRNELHTHGGGGPGGCQRSTMWTMWFWPVEASVSVVKVLSGLLSGIAYSHCVRNQYEAALANPARSNAPKVDDTNGQPPLDGSP